MTNETQHTHEVEHKPTPFGARLQSTREALGLERKDAASQLRLNEKYIIMMEKDRYPSDLPITFIRGYLRAYGKLLQIPEHEIKRAIEPIKPKPLPLKIEAMVRQAPVAVTSSNRFMQLFTTMVLLTMLSLVGSWWYDHTKIFTDPEIASNQPLAIPAKNDPLPSPVLAANKPAEAPPIVAHSNEPPDNTIEDTDEPSEE